MNLIIYPQTDEKVQMNDIIGGFITSLGKPLQVYVLANDNRWYLQQPVEVFGRFWSCGIVYGDNNTKVGDTFYAAVVQSKKRPHSPVMDLAEDIVDYVRVERATPSE